MNDTERCFGTEVIRCPVCDHGIDPHGVDPGGPCGVGDAAGVLCPCLMQPNGIASMLLNARKDSDVDRRAFVAMNAWRGAYGFPPIAEWGDLEDTYFSREVCRAIVRALDADEGVAR